MQVTVSATLPGFGSSNIIRLQGPTSPALIGVRRFGFVDTTLTLPRGSYTLTVAADANNLQTSVGTFAVSLSFSAP